MRAKYSRNQGYTIASSRRRASRPTVRTVQRKLSFGPTTAKYFGLAILAILAIVMATRSGGDSANVYKALDLTKQISNTQSQIDEAQVEAARAESLQAAENTQAESQMQQVTNVQYIQKGQVAGAATTAP